VAVVGWFGFPAREHGMGRPALTTRSAAPTAAPMSDPDAIARVATSGAGVRRRGLDARHIVQ